MEYGPGFTPEFGDDDKETTSAEKKDKKDAKEVVRKASFLELVGAEKKPEADKEAGKPKPELEASQPPEKLDDTEVQIASEQLVDDRLETVETELEAAEPDSDAEVAAVAAAAFLEKIGSQLDEGEVLSDDMLDAAASATAEELGAPPEELEMAEESAQAEFEDDEDDQADDQPAAAAGGSGGGTPPPTPPTPPAGGPPSGGGPAAPNFGFMPMPAMPNTAPSVIYEQSAESSTESRHSHARYVLAGGLLGYLLGRRRGRIKTEKRLLPVQKKLERQVGTLQEKLVIREEAIRKLALAHRHELGSAERQTTQKLLREERAKRAEKLKVYETTAYQQPEKIGKLVVSARSAFERPGGIETMSDKQVVEVAKNIQIEGTTLDVLYRQGRVELHDLIEIVREFLRGGSYEKLLIKSVKPVTFESLDATTAGHHSPNSTPTKLADLLPPLVGAKSDEQLRFGPEKETHIVARVGVAAGGVALVVVLGALIALWLLDRL